MDQINLLVLFVPTVPGSRAQGSRRLKLSAEMLSYFMGLIPTKNDTRRFLFFQEKKNRPNLFGLRRDPSPSSKIPEAPASAGRKLSQKVLPSRKIFARR